MTFVVASATTFTLVTVFQCTPVRRAWQLDLPGKCINYNAVGWANAGLNIFQDILIVVLPIGELRSLQISSKKKIGLYAMFGVGSLYGFFSLPCCRTQLIRYSVCITGIIRLYTLKNFGLTADPTWNNVLTIFWSTMETTAAVFCACMPSMRAGLVRLFPKIFGSTNFFKSSKGVSSNWSSRLSGTAKKVTHARYSSRDLNTNTTESGIELDTKNRGKFVRITDAMGSEVALKREDNRQGQLTRHDVSRDQPPVPRKDSFS